MKLTALTAAVSAISLFLYFFQNPEKKFNDYEVLDYNNTTFFNEYKDADYNDFFSEIQYLVFESIPYSPLDVIDQLRIINDTFYVTDINSRGRIFLFTEYGEFINKVGFEPQINASGETFFEKCNDSGHLIIGYPDEQSLMKFSNDGDFVSRDSVGFYFGNFVYNSNLNRYLFHTYMPYPGFSDSLNHQVVLTDSNFTVIDKHFPRPYNISKEFNVTYAVQRSNESADYVYYADFFNGEIYELDSSGNKKLIYKIEDGIEDRQDSVLMLNAEFPSYEVVMHNKRFYPFTGYYVNEDFLILFNYFEQRVRTHVVFNRETLNGNRFASNIPINLESWNRFNFHFETPVSAVENQFIQFRSVRSWSQMLDFLPDSIDISHLPHPTAEGPVLKFYNFDKEVIGKTTGD